MESRTIKIVVVGEGVTGLCIAYWLKKRGLEVTVLAKDAEAGGTMKSRYDKGFLFETGANTALETTPLFKEIIADLHLEEEFTYANPEGKNRYILRNGKLVAMPLGGISFLTTSLFSPSAKFRVLKEPFIGRGENEESVAEFVTRRLGHEFLDYAIDPFVAGVFAGKPERLSVQAAFPKLYALEKNYGGLVKGMIKGAKERKKREEKAKDRAETFSFHSGMQRLPGALAAFLAGNMIFNAKVSGIRKNTEEHGVYTVDYSRNGKTESIKADSVIFATAAYDAAPIVQQLSHETANVLNSIYYSPVVSIFLGYARKNIGRALNGFGFLVPTKERRTILGCLWNSSLFTHRAPEGMVALNVFIGGARQPELCSLNDDHIIDETTKALSSIMQISGKPVYLNITRWEKSIPQYELGYQSKLDELQRFEQQYPGIFLAGNYRGGISVGDCVKSAHEFTESFTKNLHNDN